MSLRSHLMNIDELIKLHDSRLYALERSFHQDLKTLQGDFNAEKDIITGKFQNEKKELNAIIDSIEAQEEARDNDVSNECLYIYVISCVISCACIYEFHTSYLHTYIPTYLHTYIPTYLQYIYNISFNTPTPKGEALVRATSRGDT